MKQNRKSSPVLQWIKKYPEKLFTKLFGFGLSAVYLAQNSGINNSLFQNVGTQFGGAPGSPAQATSAGQLIILIVQILLLVAGSIAVIFLSVGGYKRIAAKGDSEAVESANKTVSGAVIGLVIIILAFAVVRIVSAILFRGVPGLNII